MLKNLKKLRLEAGISQNALAEQISVSQQSVNKYENHNIEPDIQTLILIADYFGTSVDYLIGHTQEQAACSTCAMTYDEFQLVQSYRKLKPQQKQAVQTLVDSYH